MHARQEAARKKEGSRLDSDDDEREPVERGERTNVGRVSKQESVKPGKVTEMRKVYEDTAKPHYAESGVLPPYENSKWQFARTRDEIEGMRGAGG